MELRQSAANNLRSVNRQDRTVDIIASTFDIDSYGTRIDQAGWDLSQFKKNPVICLQHDANGWTSSNGLPVAKAIPETVRVENNQLVMRIKFPDQGKFQLADQVFELVADGFLNGVSVGFEYDEQEVVEETSSDGYKHSVTIYRKVRLFEVSIVTLPANDNAVVVRAKEMNREDEVEAIRTRMQEVERLANELIQSKTSEAAQEYVQRCVTYFETKKHANKASTKVLKAFYAKVLKSDPPADEVKAWERMGEAVDAIRETTDDSTKPDLVEEPVATADVPADKPEEPITPPAPTAPEAPETAQKDSVQIPISVLMELPAKLARTYVDSAVEALQRGIPFDDAVQLIDGTNAAVCNSISQFSHGPSTT